jgi:hypothetical protein
MLHSTLRTTLLCALAVTACGDDDGSEPLPDAVVTIVYTPNPIPWSAGPGTTQTCASAPNVWRFSAVFTESAGTGVSLTSVSNVVDGVSQPALTIALSIPALGSGTLLRELCFTAATQHTLQSTFTGTDEEGRSVSFSGPQVTLSAQP